ncbi:HopJ type III effector protein [Thaumasiovibrio sp. DFM-14]|uniref:HopJ type III effector protein n=1 Tax=Thaumasiovibrio sp. DFM-14 TaxID=3384792 RepID=UPI0039A1421A
METLISKLRQSPDSISFDEVMHIIQQHYVYTPTAFSNGKGNNIIVNVAGTNEGSCRIFAFAKLNNLTESETLACFGHHYRDDVLRNPEGSDHSNIRTFMRFGWAGISFAGNALSPLT